PSRVCREPATLVEKKRNEMVVREHLRAQLSASRVCQTSDTEDDVILLHRRDVRPLDGGGEELSNLRQMSHEDRRERRRLVHRAAEGGELIPWQRAGRVDPELQRARAKIEEPCRYLRHALDPRDGDALLAEADGEWRIWNHHRARLAARRPDALRRVGGEE